MLELGTNCDDFPGKCLGVDAIEDMIVLWEESISSRGACVDIEKMRFY